MLGLQLDELAHRLRRRHHRARLVAAERIEPIKLHPEGGAADAAEEIGDLARQHIIDVADEKRSVR